MQTRIHDGRAGLVGASGRVSFLGFSMCSWMRWTPGSSGCTAALAPPAALKLLGRAALAAPPAALPPLRTSPCKEGIQGVCLLLAAHLPDDKSHQQRPRPASAFGLRSCLEAPAQC